MPIVPVTLVLIGLDFGVGIIAGWQHRHKNWMLADFPSFWIAQRYFQTGIIHL